MWERLVLLLFNIMGVVWDKITFCIYCRLFTWTYIRRNMQQAMSHSIIWWHRYWTHPYSHKEIITGSSHIWLYIHDLLFSLCPMRYRILNKKMVFSTWNINISSMHVHNCPFGYTWTRTSISRCTNEEFIHDIWFSDFLTML